MAEKKYITLQDFDEWEAKYRERFGRYFGTFEWFLLGEKIPKAIELIQRALERGSPVTAEEYYKELVGLDDELFEAYKRGELRF